MTSFLKYKCSVFRISDYLCKISIDPKKHRRYIGVVSLRSFQGSTLALFYALRSKKEWKDTQNDDNLLLRYTGQMEKGGEYSASVAKRFLTWILIVIIIHFADCLCCLSTARGTMRYVYTRCMFRNTTFHVLFKQVAQKTSTKRRDVNVQLGALFPRPTKGKVVLSPVCLRFAQCLLRINRH